MEKGIMGSSNVVVCVTGAGGYIASSLIQLLLSRSYTFHGTIRDPNDDAKYDHLMKLEKASENLKLFKADILDYDSISAAVTGCVGVFHVACPAPFEPVSNPQLEIMEPAMKGTLNVLKACSEAKVKRVVYVSSAAAVVFNPNWPVGQVKDENCWTDQNFCRNSNYWHYSSYCLYKTQAEIEAFGYAKRSGLDVVSFCMSLALGPMVRPTVNSSSSVLISLLKDGCESMENKVKMIVDVRDVAAAMLLIFEKPEAQGRYICNAHHIRLRQLVDMLKHIYPNYKYPKNITELADETKLGSDKLQRLGWSFRPLEETLIDSVESYKKLGVLD